MKTPFDVAVEVLRRRTDEIRIAIASAADQLTEIKDAQVTLAAAIRNERALAASQLELPSAAYLARLDGARERLICDEQRYEAKLSLLREQALESHASLKAVEGAAQSFAVEADRVADIAEQASFDDITSTRFSRSIRLMRAPQERLRAS